MDQKTTKYAFRSGRSFSSRRFVRFPQGGEDSTSFQQEATSASQFDTVSAALTALQNRVEASYLVVSHELELVKIETTTPIPSYTTRDVPVESPVKGQVLGYRFQTQDIDGPAVLRGPTFFSITDALTEQCGWGGPAVDVLGKGHISLRRLEQDVTTPEPTVTITPLS